MKLPYNAIGRIAKILKAKLFAVIMINAGFSALAGVLAPTQI